MKKLKYIFFASVIGLASCKKEQLELYPYNQIETSQAFNTEADVTLAVNGMYAGLRTSTSYFVNGIWNIMADVLADNLIINQAGRQTLKTYGEWRYTGESTSGLFAGGYTIVRRANAILENIESFPDGTFKNNTKGEALALRALVYFDMARLFSKTYENASDADLTMPYITTTDETIKPANESLKGFYGKVIADLEQAKTLIGSSNGIYRLNKSSVSGLLSRVYLYKGDMAATITAANEALGATPNLPGRADFPKIWTDEAVTSGNNFGLLFKVRNTKLDNVNSQGVNYYQVVSGERKSEYVVEFNFNAMFSPEDIRTSAYISKSKFNQVDYNNVIKYHGRTNGDPAGVVDAKVLRTAEVLLNRAEAYYRSNNIPAAVADLLLLKSNRYSPYDVSTTPDKDLTGQALLNEILLQRRFELAFEGDRFFDLKRRNQPIQRDGTKGEKADGTGTPYVFTSLPAGDHKFQLPFPQNEVNYNTNLKQNPGY